MHIPRFCLLVPMLFSMGHAVERGFESVGETDVIRREDVPILVMAERCQADSSVSAMVVFTFLQGDGRRLTSEGQGVLYGTAAVRFLREASAMSRPPADHDQVTRIYHALYHGSISLRMARTELTKAIREHPADSERLYELVNAVTALETAYQETLKR